MVLRKLKKKKNFYWFYKKNSYSNNAIYETVVLWVAASHWLLFFMHICRYSSVVEHVIGNDGVVSPILTSGTSFLLSPYFKGFFYALFSAHFNMHVGVTRHSRRQTRQNHLIYLDKPTILPERICKRFNTFARMHLSFFPEF